MNNSSFFELYKETLPFSIESVKPAVYPNPSSDFITIPELNNGLQPIVYKVQIFDGLGIEVMSIGTGLDQSQQRIDISHLPAGVYFVKVSGNNGAYSIVEKFVKM